MSRLTADIERQVEEQVGIPVTIEEDGDNLVVTAIVTSEGEHDEVLDLVTGLAAGRAVNDNVDVGGVLAEETGAYTLTEMDLPDLPGATQGYADESLEAGDFEDLGDETMITDGWSASGPTSAIDDDVVSEGDAVFVPPTDPVGNAREIIGGLSVTSMDSIAVARSSDGTLGDEGIADAIRRELREDAATTALVIDVAVRGGVVRLRGRVRDIEDAENAEEVAARVPGVVEVREELDVEAMANTGREDAEL